MQNYPSGSEEFPELFEYTFTTAQGLVDFLAERIIEDEGKTLHLKDAVIYSHDGRKLSGLVKAVLAGKTELTEMATKQGFKKLRITGTRVMNSSSANPGKFIDKVINLLNE